MWHWAGVLVLLGSIPGPTGPPTLEIIGSNPAAVRAYMTGLDYVKLEPEP